MSQSSADVPADDKRPRIPDHDLIRPIGSGGFGDVWLATNQTTGQLRAVKLIPLRRRGETDPAGREIASITRLEQGVRGNHPHLLLIYHIGQTEAFLFYVMEPADDIGGGPPSASASYRPATLDSRLREGLFAPEQCTRYGRQLLEGLASLHEAGMVHRDVKPANCLFVHGELKLADFGLLTADGSQVSRVGTRAYMPPDGRMDVRADVYAAGLVLYGMLTGLPPEQFPRLGSQASRIAESPTLAMLNRLVLRACEPEPSRRFADARTMLAEMPDPAAADVARPARSHGRTIVALTCLLMAVVAAATAWWATGRQGPPTPAVVGEGVAVNFISHPHESTICVDGRLLVDDQGTPFTTPCTVADLTPGVHHVVFRHAGRHDLDAGGISLGKVREVEVSWGSADAGQTP